MLFDNASKMTFSMQVFLFNFKDVLVNHVDYHFPPNIPQSIDALSASKPSQPESCP